MILLIEEKEEEFEFKLELFKTKYKERYPLRQVPSDDFLIWFIGFVEGDSCFQVSNRNDLLFVVIQGIENIEVLNEIQKVFGFGLVTSQGISKRVWRFCVQDLLNIELIILLFNGNMILPTRQVRFKAFLDIYNKKIEKGTKATKKGILFPNIQLITRYLVPTLNNAWISGIVDSEGCFSISIKKTRSYNIIFCISQKGEENIPKLSKFIQLFEMGYIQPHSQKKNYSYIAGGVKNLTTKLLPKQYFENYPMKTTKQKSYILWLNLINRIKNKEHLNPNFTEYLIVQAGEINNIRRKSK
uniref:Endonuclease ai2a n=1 Tax=Dictyostelium citrinum TaxID=361072 RepID=Q2LCQ1_DICCI|nr:endonuclease ai2a [Dictyostelium citrinum]ABC60392.1 endonuclease ai2a [Dictyostelium citrinum]